MDPSYDTEPAKCYLEAKINAHDPTRPFNHESLNKFNPFDYQIVNIEQPPSWRIASTNENGEFEERIFDLYGILCGHELPPFESIEDIDNLRKKAHYLRQSIRITGLGSDAFKAQVDMICDISHAMNFCTNKDNITLHTWHPSLYEDFETIDCNARYLTSQHLIPHEKGLPFECGVDPNDILSQVRGQEFIHGQDNKVIYLYDGIQENGITKICPTLPNCFRIGDLVKATVAIAAFPYKTDRAMLTILLKSLTLLKESISGNEDSPEPIKPRFVLRKSSHLKRKTFVIAEEDH